MIHNGACPRVESAVLGLPRTRRTTLRYNVLFISEPSIWGGGAEARLLALAEGLARGDVGCTLVTSAEGELAARARAAGIATTVLPPAAFVRKRDLLTYYVTGVRALRDVMRAGAVDIVHTNDNRSVIPALRAAGPLHLPVVSHVVDMDRPWLVPRTRRALNQAAAVVAVNRAVRDYLVRGGIAEERVHVVYRGFDAAPFSAARDSRQATRQALGIGSAEIVAGLFARLHPRKRQEDVLHALASDALRALPVRVLVVGADQDPRGANERRLRALAVELGVAGRVLFLGHRDDVPALMAACDLTVAPFVNEAFGGVLAESMHAGRPVAGYDSGGIPEVVRDGIEGVLVPPADVAALASAVARLAVDERLRDRLAEGALRRAGDFAFETQLRAIRALHEQVIAARRAAA